MAPRTSPNNASDHDLLIRIDTRLEVLQSSVRENNTAMALRLDQLQKEKASYQDLDVLRRAIEEKERALRDDAGETKKQVETQQKDIDWAKRRIYIAVGALGAAQVIGWLLAIFLNRFHL